MGVELFFSQFLVFFATPRQIIITFSFPLKSNINLRLCKLDLLPHGKADNEERRKEEEGSSSFQCFYWLNIEVSATAHSFHKPWHLLSEDYFKVFQSLIQFLQVFFVAFIDFL